MTSARLRSYHEALSRAREYEFPRLLAHAKNVFGGTESELAADRLYEAHFRRVTAKGNPAECDRIAKEVCG